MRTFLLPAGWAMLILVFSVGPGVQMPASIFSPDKIAHGVSYGILEWLVLNASFKIGKLNFPRAICLTILVSLYGVVLEYLQLYCFPKRFFDFWDMLANFFGATTSLIIFYFFTKT